MEQIDQYGLHWTVKERPFEYGGRAVFLKQNALVFGGFLDIKLFWGPYIYVEKVYLREDCKENGVYNLPNAQCFFAPELEPLCNQSGMSNLIHWYHTLHNGFTFSKSAFKQDKEGEYWRMSFTTAIGSREDAFDVAKLFQEVQFSAPNSKMFVSVLKYKYPFLWVHDRAYKLLPQKWTVDDLYNIDKEFYESFKKQYEQLWHDIAESRAQHKPIEITAYEHITNLPVIYTERVTYGVALPTVIARDEERSR